MPTDHSSGVPGNDFRWRGGEQHRATRNRGEIDLFLWHEPAAADEPHQGTILFVHGASMASQPTFDLDVPGQPDSSAMSWFRARGLDAWTFTNPQQVYP